MLERREARSRSEALALIRAWLPGGRPDRFGRLEVALPAFEPLDLDLYPRVRWRSRGGDLRIETAGCALQAELPQWERNNGLLGELEDRVDAETYAALRWFLWGRFDAMTQPSTEWTDYGARRLLLPSLEMRQTDGRVVLACNCNAQGLPALRDVLEHCLPNPPSGAGGTNAIESGSSPTRPEWATQIARIQKLIEAEPELQKVVLARRATWEVGALAPDAFLDAAAALQPESYHLMIQPNPGTAFVAISPERLYRRRGRDLESEALAGTRRRTADVTEDHALGAQLLDSAKDRREQRLVLEQILAALQPLTTRLEHDAEPHLRRLRDVQHLCNEVRGELNDSVGDGDLLAALHPTPAVAGQPPRRAREVIAGMEPFDRGLYAGPVGCCSRDETEVAVAIRSALFTAGSLNLYAGVGLLSASDADAEWQESCDKMALLQGLLQDLAAGRSGKAAT